MIGAMKAVCDAYRKQARISNGAPAPKPAEPEFEFPDDVDPDAVGAPCTEEEPAWTGFPPLETCGVDAR
jgi:hypothetical protein